mmetsp:Transcript_7325/g.21583  ORF Transcript_7325/g.21583 Transcript_7325/m.21583 type:complete len:312 (-) Transcript_7325:1066-2001(-)
MQRHCRRRSWRSNKARRGRRWWAALRSAARGAPQAGRPPLGPSTPAAASFSPHFRWARGTMGSSSTVELLYRWRSRGSSSSSSSNRHRHSSNSKHFRRSSRQSCSRHSRHSRHSRVPRGSFRPRTRTIPCPRRRTWRPTTGRSSCRAPAACRAPGSMACSVRRSSSMASCSPRRNSLAPTQTSRRTAAASRSRRRRPPAAGPATRAPCSAPPAPTGSPPRRRRGSSNSRCSRRGPTSSTTSSRCRITSTAARQATQWVRPKPRRSRPFPTATATPHCSRARCTVTWAPMATCCRRSRHSSWHCSCSRRVWT